MLRGWLFAAGLALFASAGAAAAAAAAPSVSPPNPILRVVADNTDVDHSDPALAYSVLGWQIEYETCTPLVGYSDRSGTRVNSAVTPIGTTGMPVVSNGGKTYVFTVRSGLKFSDGTPLTAANYKYAFDRDALHKLNSPVTAFMGAVKGWNVENNHAGVTSVSGVTANGNTLTIQLYKPQGTLLPILALPFFCPIEQAAPFYVGGKWADSEVNAAYPGSGPYYLATRNVGTDIVLQRNPYYAGARPHRASTIQIDMNVSQNNAYTGISDGTYAADLNGNPEPANNRQLAKQFGINKTRFWVEPTMIVSYLAMNTQRPIFRSAAVRKGVNYAIDRPGLIKLSGYLSGSPTVQLLPKQLAGGVWSTKLYPITTPNHRQFHIARQISHDCGLGHTRTLYYLHGSTSIGLEAAAIVKNDLQQMGCAKIVDRGYCGYCRYIPAGQPPPPVDIRAAGWSDDYPDAYDYLGILLDGRHISQSNNNDLAFFNNAEFNRRLDHANLLTGGARARAFGELDQWVMTKYAPLVPISTTNFVDYLGPNAHGYVYNGPLACADLGDLYQS